MTALANAVPPPAPPRARQFLARLAALAVAWLALTGADAGSWIIGAPAVLVGAWLSLRLLPAATWRWTPAGALAFAGFFLRESLCGGWDVARRALVPGLPLNPGLVTFFPRLPAGAPRWFFCGVVSLLPGTAVISIAADAIAVHVLDASPGSPEDLRKLEDRVAALFGLTLLRAGSRESKDGSRETDGPVLAPRRPALDSTSGSCPSEARARAPGKDLST